MGYGGGGGLNGGGGWGRLGWRFEGGGGLRWGWSGDSVAGWALDEDGALVVLWDIECGLSSGVSHRRRLLQGTVACVETEILRSVEGGFPGISPLNFDLDEWEKIESGPLWATGVGGGKC
ncbi:hypothetical protein Tco_1010993 [Tanacetum coccineum]